MMKSIMKITLMSVALAIPVISEAASGKTPTQRLADSFLCKGIKTEAQQGKMLKGLVLSGKRLPSPPASSDVIQIGPEYYEKIITLKEPLVYRHDLQSNKIFVIYEDKTDKIISAMVLFKEPYLQLGKKLPGKFKRTETDDEELVQKVGSRTVQVLSFWYKGLEEFKSSLQCSI